MWVVGGGGFFGVFLSCFQETGVLFFCHVRIALVFEFLVQNFAFFPHGFRSVPPMSSRTSSADPNVLLSCDGFGGIFFGVGYAWYPEEPNTNL